MYYFIDFLYHLSDNDRGKSLREEIKNCRKTMPSSTELYSILRAISHKFLTFWTVRVAIFQYVHEDVCIEQDRIDTIDHIFASKNQPLYFPEFHEGGAVLCLDIFLSNYRVFEFL